MPYGPHPSSSPPTRPPPRLRELPDDIDALDAELGALAGRRMAWGRPLCWARPLTHAAYADPADAEFTLVGHARRGDALILDIVVCSTGAQGPLEIRPPDFRLCEALPSRPGQAPCPFPAPDADGSVRRRRDDMLRRVFS